MSIKINEENYLSLSQSEQQVIDFLNENEELLPELSITTIAARTYTSLATVSRAIRKCGFDGIAHLRYSLQQKNAPSNDETFIMNDVLAKAYRECSRTIDNISLPQILKIITYIKKSRRIFLYSRGYTALVADEFAHHLVCLGYNAFVMKDSVVMQRSGSILRPDDLVIIISVHNTTPELAESAAIANEIGAKVVTLCCEEGTNLEKYSEVTVIGYSESLGACTFNVSRVSLSIICHIIIEYLDKTA